MRGQGTIQRLGQVPKFYPVQMRGGGTLGSDVTLKPQGVPHSFVPDYAQKCRTRSPIMAPIEFWRNSDLFQKNKKNLAQKLEKSEHIFKISQNFIKKSFKSEAKIIEMLVSPLHTNLNVCKKTTTELYTFIKEVFKYYVSKFSLIWDPPSPLRHHNHRKPRPTPP